MAVPSCLSHSAGMELWCGKLNAWFPGPSHNVLLTVITTGLLLLHGNIYILLHPWIGVFASEDGLVLLKF